MKIDVELAQLHNPLFLNGTNLQLKLDPSVRKELILIYDRDEKELLVYLNGKVAIVPNSNVASMTLKEATAIGALPSRAGQKDKAKEKVKEDTEATIERMEKFKAGLKGAQVSSPTDHVFQPGAGKTRN